MKTNMVKRLAAAMLAATVAIGTPMAVSAAWKTEGKGWNWTVNGQNATGWQMIDNTWYYFNAQGTMQTGWVQYGNSWFFLQPSGAMATGWVNDNGQYYYTKSNGAMATGWVQDNGTWYCMSSSGAMRTGWVASGNDWYYLAPTGAMVTGAVIKVDNAVYSIAADGSMQTGEVTIAGKTYTFGEDGAATGDNIPEPDRTFSSAATPGGTAAETTPTTPPADTTPTTPSKPNRPSYGGGGSTTPDPEPDPIPTEQKITVRPAGEAEGVEGEFNYKEAYTAAGFAFDPATNTISYTPTGTPINDALCQTLDKKYGFIGLVFEKPTDEATWVESVRMVDGSPVENTRVKVDLTDGVNDSVHFKGDHLRYIGVAPADGKAVLPEATFTYHLIWKTAEDGEVIKEYDVTITRAAAEAWKDPSNPDGGSSGTTPPSEPSGGSGSNSGSENKPDTEGTNPDNNTEKEPETEESAQPTNDGE